MNKTLDAYPSIKKALIEIAYDNGMVHRDTTESSECSLMFANLIRKYTVAQVEELEAELALLSPEQIWEVCSDPEQHHWLSDLGNEMLDWAFDGPDEETETTVDALNAAR